MGFFLGTQERVRNSLDGRAISIRATEVLLYSEDSEMASKKRTRKMQDPVLKLLLIFIRQNRIVCSVPGLIYVFYVKLFANKDFARFSIKHS